VLTVKKKIHLDTSKLLGFRVVRAPVDSGPRNGLKAGLKTGVKAGGKIGAKFGTKIGIKR
jgi:hypothetical protein